MDLNNNLNDKYSRDFRITDQFPYPKYKPPDNYHDIALFKLSSSVTFNAYIRPVCLSTEPYKASSETTVIVTGYGYKNEGTHSEKYLDSDKLNPSYYLVCCCSEESRYCSKLELNNFQQLNYCPGVSSITLFYKTSYSCSYQFESIMFNNWNWIIW